MHGDGGVCGPLLIIAGAGSGKTNTLAHRVAHLIVRGADPRRILLMTFSRRAAAEMTKRVERIAGEVLGRDASVVTDALTWAGTFHGVGARLLRDYALEIGLDPAFTIHDREDSADLMNLVRHELGLSKTESALSDQGHVPGDLFARGQRAGAARRGARRSVPVVRRLGGRSSSSCSPPMSRPSRRRTCSITTICCSTGRRWPRSRRLAEHLGQRFDHILVDEYQDTNRLQASILSALKPDGQGLTVVGDDAQSIYSFRAAEVRNILDFPKQFATPAEIVTLDRNYRSTETILAAANAVIGEASERFTKNLWTERRSARTAEAGHRRATRPSRPNYVCEKVLAEREAGTLLKAQAVLFRASHHSGPLEIELTRRNIPFVKFGGLKFLDAAHVKDVLAVLRFAENPRDRVAGFRVLQLLPGIGPSTAAQIVEAMDGALDPAMGLAAFRPPQRAEADWPAFVDAVFRAARRRPRPGQPTWNRSGSWYEPHLERIHEDATVRRADLVQLEQIAAGYPSRERFLTELTLDPPDATSDHAGPPHLDEDYLILSTIHSAKGQEWKNVFVLNTVDGCIPADLGVGTKEEIDEERRLLYVAMTRARDALHLIMPQRFYPHGQPARGDRHIYASRTRFIPASILDRFESCTWPLQGSAGPGAHPRDVRVDLKSRMRGMWG